MKTVDLFLITVLLSLFFFCNTVRAESPINIDSVTTLEKVYLHTDRNCYFAGDDIWFKAYLIDALFGLLSDHSNNLHVELISPDASILESRIIRLSEGLGDGDFKLPDDLNSGQYQLRAYTNYMRNFDAQLFYTKNITIINSSDTTIEVLGNTKHIKNNTEISFFPEGGSLVDYISSIVAYKAVNALGAGCEIAGEIHSSTGELVTTFKSTHLGMGTFSLKPLPGLSYYAVFKNPDGEEMKIEIPKSFTTGVTIGISKNKGNQLSAEIKTNNATLPLVLDHDFLLTISARKTILEVYKFRMKSLINNLNIQTKNLPDGIVMLTITGTDNLPLCERLVYLQKSEDIKLKLETNQVAYNKRDSINIKLSLSADSGSWEGAYLSLSAAEKKYSLSNSQYPSSISSWFLLESDVRGPIEEPSYYFDISNHNRLHDLDLLLLTQGWRDFEWKFKEMNYLPEKGFTVSGRLRKLFINTPLENFKVNIGIFDNENTLVTDVLSDSVGRFHLEGIDFTGNARLIASAVGGNEKYKGWLMLDSLNYSPAKIQSSMTESISLTKENLGELKEEAEWKRNIKKQYSLSDTIFLEGIKVIAEKPKDPQAIQIERCRRIYGEPDNEVIITPDLEGRVNILEAIKLKVPGIIIYFNKLQQEYHVYIRSSFTQGKLLEPVFLIDGFRTSIDAILMIPVSWVDRVDIIKTGTSAYFGAGETSGAISIITKAEGPRSAKKQVFHSANIKISGYDAPRIFYSPTHTPDPAQAYEPDLRATLYWEPYIKVDTSKDIVLKYFNADNPTTILVTAEGITTNGVPVTGKLEYLVK